MTPDEFVKAAREMFAKLQRHHGRQPPVFYVSYKFYQWLKEQGYKLD